jgi:hypothetical protein
MTQTWLCRLPGELQVRRGHPQTEVYFVQVLSRRPPMISSTIRVLQVNLNRSAPATESALQIAVELKIDIVVVQEPWILRTSESDYSSARLILHQSFVQILPNTVLRPRTLVYVLRSFGLLVTIATNSTLDSNLLAIDITEGNSKIQLLNIYNELD